jgi:hypothetical protein
VKEDYMALAAVVQSAAASARSRQPHQDLRAVVEDLRRKHKRAGDARIAQALEEMLEDDPPLLRAAARFILDRIPAVRSPSVTERTARQSARAVEKAAVQKLATAARQQIVLDTMVTLLSGETKAIRFCLGRELAALGGAFSRLAAQVPADSMLGEVVVERELAELLRAPAVKNGG